MRWLKSIGREVLGLFVDDGNFAIGILAWAAVAILVFGRITGRASWTGPALFSGLAIILIVSVLRFSRRAK